MHILIFAISKFGIKTHLLFLMFYWTTDEGHNPHPVVLALSVLERQLHSNINITNIENLLQIDVHEEQ